MGSLRPVLLPRALGALILGLVLALSGCTDSDPGAQRTTSPRPEGPPTYAGAELPDLVTEPVNLPDDLRITGVFGQATVIDDVLFLGGRDDHGRSLSAAVDLATGRLLWQTAAGGGEDRWAVDDGRGGLVIGHTYSGAPNRTGEYGIVAHRLRGRKTLWRATVVPSVDRRDPRAEELEDVFPEIVGASRTVVVVNAGDRVMGFDTATGERLWVRRDSHAGAVARDVVLVTDATHPGAGKLRALDAATGEVSWEVIDQLGVWLERDPGDELAVASLDGGKFGLISLRDGTLLTDAASSLIGYGSDAGGEYAAWVHFDAGADESYRLASQGLDDDEPLIGAEALDIASVGRAAAGYAWLILDAVVVAVDRTGAVRSDELPGFPRLVTDEYVVTDDAPRGRLRLQVWRYGTE